MQNSMHRESRWLSSLNEFRSPRTVAFCGVMCALAAALGSFATINIGPYLKVGFSGMPNIVVDYLFGPAVGAFFAGALEIIKFLLRPDGVYFPGFTLSAVLGGVIYGFAFYRRPVTLLRAFCAHALVKAFVNIGLNTLWLSILYKQAAAVLLPARVAGNLVSLPVDTLLTYALLRAIGRVIPHLRRKNPESQ